MKRTMILIGLCLAVCAALKPSRSWRRIYGRFTAYMRIVLDWGQRPADLDLHLEKEGGYHISYWDMHNAADGSVTLDRDDRDGFGPETITIMETDLRSVYRVYVHDYTNGGSSSSTELSRSYAAIRVYGRNGLLRSFYVPENRRGNMWEVFRIVNGEIVQ